MGKRALENRVKQIKELEEQISILEAEKEAIKTSIKKEMEKQGTDELITDNFIIRFTKVITSRFDSKKFKADYPFMYGDYLKQTESHRFSIS